jgi:hypothetical protein
MQLRPPGGSASADDDGVWTDELLDAASFRLAAQSARAAGIPLEDWLARTIHKACAASPAVAERPETRHDGATARGMIRRPRSRGPAWPWLVILAALVAAGGGYVYAHRAAMSPPRAVEIIVPLPPPPAPAPPPVPALATPPIPAEPPAAAAPDQEPSDPAELAHWLEPRATRGDALAQYRLGTMYSLGKGVALDYARAAPLLRAAAESGLAEAEYDYGVLCEKGNGVPKDAVQAVAWYRKAATQGNANAALSLGYAYAKGYGVDSNTTEAAQWFRRAAELGLVDAQYNLGWLYEHGEGVARSPVDAYAWYRLAAARGDKAAQGAADRIGRELSARQLRDAQARALELQGAIKSAR